MSRSTQGANVSSAKVEHRWQPFASVLVTLTAIVIAANGRSIGWDLALVLFVLSAIALSIASAYGMKAIDKAMPIEVMPDGLKCYDGIGNPAFVRWDEVKRTRNMILWPGLRWIMFDDGRGYMSLPGIPAFMKNRRAFYDEVESILGESHVVCVSLRKSGF